MGDHLTHGLARNGFSCLKLIPCGSVSDVMPWLARRVQVVKIKHFPSHIPGKLLSILVILPKVSFLSNFL